MPVPDSEPPCVDRSMERYAHLVAQGKIKLKPVTADDGHHMQHDEVPEDVDPLALLLGEREEGERL
ncbi:hypothetical protein AB0942_34650 [Streptomyces nodosus]|uniref:hypothetical protein n=1 Tax=Streptomyces nodosus TaxID=40318 RepID=UPI0034545F64